MHTAERASSYISKLPPAVAGSGGHDATFRVACILVHGFALESGTALELLREWNLTHCSPPWRENELAHKIRSAAAQPDPRHGWALAGGKPETDPYHTGRHVQPPPRPPAERTVPFSAVAAARIAACSKLAHPDAGWLRSISPLDPAAATTGDFFRALYRPGEISLILTNPYSQGDYAWWVGAGAYRLSDTPGVSGVSSDLPLGSKDGVLYLANPVDGRWHAKAGSAAGDDRRKLSRRSANCCTRFPYLLLESDQLDATTWLRICSQIELPISAVYTSGGKSIHVLLRIGARSKSEFDARRDQIRAIYAPLGADPAAMTAVRLTRLPGMLRGTRKQELLYLDPAPNGTELQKLQPKR